MSADIKEYGSRPEKAPEEQLMLTFVVPDPVAVNARPDDPSTSLVLASQDANDGR
jgi:hypothetical protein